MKKNTLHMVIMLALMFTGVDNAASQPLVHGITVKPLRIEQSGRTLHVELDIVMDRMNLIPTEGIDLIPHLVSPEGSAELPRVSVKGRGEYLAYERSLALMNERELAAYKRPYIVERGFGRGGRTIEYRYTMPFEPWMKNAGLEVRWEQTGCGNAVWLTTDRIGMVTFEKAPAPYKVTPHLVFVKPVAEVKNREKQVEAFLDFEVNKTVIRPSYMNNPRELGKIRAMIDELRNDDDITIGRIYVTGFASPEGSFDNNRRLSEGRANALVNYIISQYRFPRSMFTISFGGENWDGLKAALAGLDIEYRDEIVNIVNNYDGQYRKERLMNLGGGTPYRYLLQNIYPTLRVAVCRAEYNIRDFDLEEARRMINIRPQNLSLDEMYVVANSYPVGSQEFTDVFEIAARLFPDDDIAKLNAAAAALSRGDTVTAERNLSRISNKTKPEYLNTAGVLAMLQDDHESARRYLDQAIAAGIVAARKNMEELEKVISSNFK